MKLDKDLETNPTRMKRGVRQGRCNLGIEPTLLRTNISIDEEMQNM